MKYSQNMLDFVRFIKENVQKTLNGEGTVYASLAVDELNYLYNRMIRENKEEGDQ